MRSMLLHGHLLTEEDAQTEPFTNVGGRPPHWHARFGLFLLPLCFFMAPAALGHHATAVLYELTPESTFQEGCFEGCACPVTAEMPIRGTFLLSPAQSSTDDAFTHWEVKEVNWTVHRGDSTQQFVGSGRYRRGGEDHLLHQLELNLASQNATAIQRFDSGLVPGGQEFPRIVITISMHGMHCYDTVIRVHAQPVPPPGPLPRRAHFVLHPDESSVELELFTGSSRSKLTGSLRLFLGDPHVPVPAVVGMVGLSVLGADLVAPDFEPDNLALPEPMRMIQDPHVRSLGAWNTQTGVIQFELHLIAPEGNLPVPMPLRLSGTLANSGLRVAGDNGDISDGTMRVKIVAFEMPLPPPAADVWFSTKMGFHAGHSTSTAPVAVSAGDLLSRRGHIIRRNHELTAHLGIMPIVPDLGLDAVVLGPQEEIWFSFDADTPRIWSETLGVWLKHGDLLSERGYVVQTNEQLLARFGRMPPVTDAGLDAVTLAPNREILFSTSESFFSEVLGRHVGHGDLLSNRGRVVRTNAQLLEKLQPLHPQAAPHPPDLGLDAVILRPEKEIWFSTQVGFESVHLGHISDGDLLSSRGHVVARNLDLVAQFAPVEDVDNFGLDALTFPVPIRIGDFDHDGHAGSADLAALRAAMSGPGVPAERLEFDLDGDGDVDQDDFGIFQRCYSGDPPADADCTH